MLLSVLSRRSKILSARSHLWPVVQYGVQQWGNLYACQVAAAASSSKASFQQAQAELQQEQEQVKQGLSIALSCSLAGGATAFFMLDRGY